MKHIAALFAVTLSLLAAAPQSAPSATAVPELPAFFAGNWIGAHDKDFVQEMWSAPQGNNMMGSFRWVTASGEIAMMELISITKESDATRMRLRHFSKGMIAKEPLDKPLVFKLTEAKPSRAVFTAEKDSGDASTITYERTGDDMSVIVDFGRSFDKRDPLALTFKRNS